MKRPAHLARPQSARRRAAVAVLTAVTMIVLLICASLAVDLGFVRAVCGDMQHTADSAALAAASALHRTSEVDLKLVRQRAMEQIEYMHKSQGFYAPEDQIIELGTWNSVTHEFTPIDETTRAPFAVRVVSVRKDTPLFFAAIMGKYKTKVTREAVAVGSGWCGGIWGLEGVRINGSVVTDSYNSDEGPYTSLTAGDNGDICSGEEVRISGAVEINGDVMCGLGYDVRVDGSAAEITGLTTANTEPVSDPPVEFGDVKYVNDNAFIPLTLGGKRAFSSGANLYLNANDTLILPPGNFYFDSITMRSGAKIVTTGVTNFYVGGKVDASGAGIVNATADPGNLFIYSLGSVFEISGSYDFYGSVLAPDADVKVSGDSQWYGALVGETVWFNGNVEVHVDESLPILDLFAPPEITLVR